MTHDITPEQVREWLKLSEAGGIGAIEIVQESDNISRAYLAKCDEVARLTNAALAFMDRDEECEKWKRISAKQRDALIRLRYEIFFGGVEEIDKIMDDALALTVLILTEE